MSAGAGQNVTLVAGSYHYSAPRVTVMSRVTQRHHTRTLQFCHEHTCHHHHYHAVTEQGQCHKWSRVTYVTCHVSRGDLIRTGRWHGGNGSAWRSPCK